MDLHIVEAKQEDFDFIVFANKMIDKASYIETSKLKENLKKDIFQDKKAVCLIVKDGDIDVAMTIFSKVYWADRGEGVYISQVYVEENYRRKGVLKMILNHVFKFYHDAQFLTCLVSKKNENMLNSMCALDFEDEQMISFAKNKIDIKTL